MGAEGAPELEAAVPWLQRRLGALGSSRGSVPGGGLRDGPGFARQVEGALLYVVRQLGLTAGSAN